MDQEEMNEKAWTLLGDLESLEFALLDWKAEATKLLEMDNSKEFLRENILAVDTFLKAQGYDE